MLQMIALNTSAPYTNALILNELQCNDVYLGL